MRLIRFFLCLALLMLASGAWAESAKTGCKLRQDGSDGVKICSVGVSAKCGTVQGGSEADERGEAKEDQDRARDALGRHEIRPLAEVFAAVAKVVPGEVVDVKLECKNRTWQYELKIVSKNRRRYDIYVNATTLEVTQDD